MGHRWFPGRPAVPRKLVAWIIIAVGLIVLLATLPVAAIFGVLLAYVGYVLQRKW
jgi:hypothetical protein